jgi:hypothetical protein
MLFKVRLLVLSLLGVMAIGMIASTAAMAKAGPYWWVRTGGLGEGSKLAENVIEQGTSSGLGTTFSTTISGNPLALEGQAQAKFDIWNIPAQGQVKIQIAFSNVHVIGKPNCIVPIKVPEDYIGHLMWKYQGIAKELSQVGTQEENGQEWDVAIAPARSILGAHGYTHQGEEPIFAKIEIPNNVTNCGVLAGGITNVTGVSAFQDQQLKVGQFAKNTTVSFPGHKVWQHYWNGTEVETLEGELTSKFGPAAAFFNGSLPLEFAAKEVDVHE